MKFFKARRDFIKLGAGIIALISSAPLIAYLTKEKKMKTVKHILNPSTRHWVGNGFYVYPSIRPLSDTYHYTSPYILMDYAAPKEFGPASEKRGVGSHPHRGFETVTFAIQGEVEHKDSTGGGGVIKEGDIQWMTAARGIIHNEFFSEEFNSRGGIFEMVQLWVNLPKKDKMSDPGYQEVKHEDMPIIKKDDISIKVIAGEYEDKKGPSKSYTPMNMLDISAKKETELIYDSPNGWTLTVLVLTGKVQAGGKVGEKGHTMLFEREQAQASLKLSSDARILLLNAEPIDEPMVAHGPFVMNTRQEIYEAIEDYQNGRMGPFEI